MTTSVVPNPEREDWAPLAGILDKALVAISEPERNAIYRKWLPVRYEPVLDYTQLWYALASFVSVFLALLVWIRKLLRAIDLREAREAELRASEERFHRAIQNSPLPILLHAEGGAVLLISDAWCDITGYGREEVATVGDWAELAYWGVEGTRSGWHRQALSSGHQSR